MVIACDPNCPMPIITEDDKNLPKDQQTIFLMTPMTRRELTSYGESFSGKTAKDIGNLDDVMKLIGSHLKGWHNFKNADGQDMIFDDKRIEDMLDLIPISSMTALFKAYFESHKLGEVEIKNLS